MYPEFDEDWGSPETSTESNLSGSPADVKRAVQMEQVQDNLESAMDLLKVEKDIKTPREPAASSSFKIQNKDGFFTFKREILSKLEKSKNVPGHIESVLDLAIGCANLLDVAGLRKLLGTVQTLMANRDRENMATRPRTQRPSLKYGGSTKYSFDCDLHNYDEDDDYEDDQVSQ